MTKPNQKGTDPEFDSTLDDILSSFAMDEDKDDGAITPAKKIPEPKAVVAVSTENLPTASVISNPIKKDRIYKLVSNQGSLSEVKTEAIKAIAEEMAYLAAVREVNYNQGLDTSKISLRRVQSARSLLDVITKEQAKTGDKPTVDFSSDPFRNVFKYILRTIAKTFTEAKIPKNYEQIFFAALSKNLEDFERDANIIISGKDPAKETGPQKFRDDDD